LRATIPADLIAHGGSVIHRLELLAGEVELLRAERAAEHEIHPCNLTQLLPLMEDGPELGEVATISLREM
jgi:hypothetical protein